MFDQSLNIKPAKLYYAGDDLGLSFSEENIFYKIWSPPAQSAFIEIYADDKGRKKLDEFKLQPDISDTWGIKLPQKYYGKYYRLRLQLPRKEYNFVDPWAKAVGTNSEYGLIIDPTQIHPPTWTNDQKVELDDPVDAVIYELHVKDFSISPESGIRNRGKYSAFTERHSVNNEGMLTGIS